MKLISAVAALCGLLVVATLQVEGSSATFEAEIQNEKLDVVPFSVETAVLDSLVKMITGEIGIASMEKLAGLLGRLEKLREFAQNLFDKLAHTRAGEAVKGLIVKIEEARQKIMERMRGARPLSEEIYFSGSLVEAHGFQEMVLKKLMDMLEAEKAHIAEVGFEPAAREALQNVKVRLEGIRSRANTLANALGNNAVGRAARELVGTLNVLIDGVVLKIKAVEKFNINY